MKIYFFLTLGMLLISVSSKAQNKEHETMYKNALKLYVEQKDTLKAIQEL